MRGDLSIRQVYAILGWPRSRHYAPVKAAPAIDEGLAQTALAIHRDSRRSYGARRLARSLCRHGFRVGRERAATLMRRLDIRLRKKRFHYARRNTKPAPAENIVNRQFDPARPNQTWAGDITFIRTGQGFLYLAIVVDLYSRRIVGWATSHTPDSRLAIKANELAIGLRQPAPGLVIHTDQGASYTSDRYTQHLARHGIVQSMSRKGNCWDNAVAESFFGSLKKERIKKQIYKNRDLALRDVADYIDRFYNHTRRHSHLCGVSPEQFEAALKRR